MIPVIVKYGDRKNSGKCLMCGTILLEPVNDYQCCTVCTEKIQKALYEFEKKQRKYTRRGKKMPKTSGRRVVSKCHIMRQAVPIGVPVK
jgi:hypothetical protein